MFGAIGVIFSSMAVWGFYEKRERERKHLEHLKAMPEGLVPVDEREGADDIVLREKLKEDYEKTRGQMFKDLRYDSGFYSLKASWDTPIISKAVAEKRFGSFVQKGKYLSQFLIATGLVGTVVGLIHLFSQEIIPFGSYIAMYGLIGLLFGAVIQVAVHALENRLFGKIPSETRVGWKKLDNKLDREIIKEFLDERGEKYEIQTEDISYCKKHKFIMEDGGYIFSRYHEAKDGNIYGVVGIGYMYSDYHHAKEILFELDEYLTERDLVDTRT